MTDWKFLLERYVLGKHRPKVGVYATEPLVAKRMKRFAGNIALDVGAGTGEYSVILAKKFRKVYAFEPNPDRVEKLRASLERVQARNVEVIEAALAEVEGKTILWLDPPARRGGTDPASTIMSVFEYQPASLELEQLSEHFEGKTGVPVKMLPLTSMKLPTPIDLLKIDVEGAEFRVLAGAATLLEGHQIRYLMVELHNKYQRPQLESLLEGYGYQFKWIDEDHMLATYLIR